MNTRTLVGLVGCDDDRFRREDREVGLLHAEVDVEPQHIGAVPLDRHEVVGCCALSPDAAEVKHLLE